MLDPVTDREKIRAIRIENLKAIRYWNDIDPVVHELAEPLSYAYYTELVHRVKGSAGLIECFSYSDAETYSPSYPILRYHKEILAGVQPEISFHLRTIYLDEHFKFVSAGVLHLLLLNTLFFLNLGVLGMTFSLNARHNPLRKFYLNLGAVELDPYKWNAGSGRLKSIQYCYVDLQTVMTRCLKLFENKFLVFNAQDIAILADSQFWSNDSGNILRHKE